MKKYMCIICLQEHEANEALGLLETEGRIAVVEYLQNWDNGDGGEEVDGDPWGKSDVLFYHGGYLMTYNTGLPVFSLYRVIEEEQVATWVPCFPGFYESVYYHSDIDIDEIDYFMNDHHEESIDALTPDEKEFIIDSMWTTKAYQQMVQAYQKRIIEQHCNVVAEQLQYILNCDVEITNLQLVSPKFYNFETDQIYADIEIDLQAVKAYLDACRKNWIQYCTERYTSHDGFTSFYSPKEVYDLKTSDLLENTHFLGTALQFILENELDIAEDIIQEVFNRDCYYTIPWEEIIEELQEKLEEFRRGHGKL